MIRNSRSTNLLEIRKQNVIEEAEETKPEP